jgi:hypothetical protein
MVGDGWTRFVMKKKVQPLHKKSKKDLSAFAAAALFDSSGGPSAERPKKAQPLALSLVRGNTQVKFTHQECARATGTIGDL